MSLRHLHSTSLLLCVAFATGSTFLASCATPYSRSPFEDPGLQGDLNQSRSRNSDAGFSYWKETEGKSSPLRIKIDLSEQAAHFYRGNTQVGRSRVATGLSTHRTPRGSFTILEKVVDKRSTLYGQIIGADGSVAKGDADSRRDAVPQGGEFIGASMPYWMRLTNSGVGMHVGPIPNPGNPASHGCIRMPQEMAVRLYKNVRLGTKVEIVE